MLILPQAGSNYVTKPGFSEEAGLLVDVAAIDLRLQSSSALEGLGLTIVLISARLELLPLRDASGDVREVGVLLREGALHFSKMFRAAGHGMTLNPLRCS